MTKAQKITYWVATIWACFGLVYTGIVQLQGIPIEVELFNSLGFPLYLMPFLGATKLLAAIVLLIPKFPRIKEWAYAGLTFTFLGALYSHLSVAHPFAQVFPPILFLILITISWFTRPADRKE